MIENNKLRNKPNCEEENSMFLKEKNDIISKPRDVQLSNKENENLMSIFTKKELFYKDDNIDEIKQCFCKINENKIEEIPVLINRNYDNDENRKAKIRYSF